jgi:hypothetical protein
MYADTQTAMAIRSKRSQTARAKNSALTKIEIDNIPIATIFVRFEIALSRFHARKVGPKTGCSSSQFSKKGELRVRQGSAKIKKMVLGMTGRIAPMIPSPTSAVPAQR